MEDMQQQKLKDETAECEDRFAPMADAPARDARCEATGLPTLSVSEYQLLDGRAKDACCTGKGVSTLIRF